MARSLEIKILWLAILAYFIFWSVFTSIRHYNFQTQTYDLTIFEQSFWNTLHGKIMVNSLEGVKNHFGMHMSPFLLLLVPGYALFPSPYYLLLIQTAALAIGALPLYLLAKKVLKDSDKKWPLIAALAYLLYPSLHWINNFDFHELPFLVPLLLSAFYFIESKRWGWTAVCLALGAAVKEDAILMIIFFGFYLFLLKQRKLGIIVSLAALFYFIISVKIIMPAWGGGLLHLSRYNYTNINFFLNSVFSPEKLNYLFWIMLPVTFLPILSGPVLITLLPGLTENLLSSAETQFSGLYHYDALLIPAVFVCAIYGLKKLFEYKKTWEKIVLFVIPALAVISFLTHSPLSPFHFPIQLFQPNPHWKTLRQIVRLIPDNVSVAAETHLTPHLAHRERIYLLGTEPLPADIVIIDGADLSGFSDENTLQAYADGYMMSGNYKFTAIKDRYFILSKKGIEL